MTRIRKALAVAVIGIGFAVAGSAAPAHAGSELGEISPTYQSDGTTRQPADHLITPPTPDPRRPAGLIPLDLEGIQPS